MQSVLADDALELGGGCAAPAELFDDDAAGRGVFGREGHDLDENLVARTSSLCGDIGDGYGLGEVRAVGLDDPTPAATSQDAHELGCGPFHDFDDVADAAALPVLGAAALPSTNVSFHLTSHDGVARYSVAGAIGRYKHVALCGGGLGGYESEPA